MKPVIAVSAQTAVSESTHYGKQRLTSLFDLYVHAIRAAGGLPVVLAQGDPADVPALLNRFDALVLPGGGDLDPTSYGEEPEAANLYGIRPETDLFEIALVREAATRRMPTLGICRGLQVINVALGGTLHQDLPEHPQDLVGRAFAGHYLTQIEPGTRLHRVVESPQLVVNSLHHQGVKDLGEALVVAAVAKDGVIEALEPADSTWEMIAVQWHPECLRVEHSAALFGWLTDAAARRATRLDVHVSVASEQPAPVVEGVAAG